MLNKGFYGVIICLFSVLFIALIVLTWREGYYFDFRKVWAVFKDYFDDIELEWRSQFNNLLIAAKKLKNYNVIGFNMASGNSVLKLLQGIANFIPYLFQVINFLLQLVLAFINIIWTYIIGFFELIGSLIAVFTLGWTKFGDDGFIQPQDWYNMVTPYFY